MSLVNENPFPIVRQPIANFAASRFAPAPARYASLGCYGCTRGNCAGCDRRMAGLGFALPDLTGYLSDWRVVAGAAAVVLLLFAGKKKGSARKRRLAQARLKYIEESARIRRAA